MKKIAVFLSIIFSLLIFPVGLGSGFYASAEESPQTTQIQEVLEEFIEYESLTPKTRNGRFPGTDAERKSAEYIREYLSTLTSFAAVNNITTQNGMQSFNFVSQIDSNPHVSQNVLFIKKAAVKTDKKVVIAAHYDSSFVYTETQQVYPDAINDNAGAVALLLSLAKRLDAMTELPFNVEIAFFGAGTNDYAGSRYFSRTMDEKDAENTLLLINLDRVALGDYNYMYVNEYETSQQKYFEGLLKESNIKKLRNLKVMDIEATSPNGLNYTHIGLESDHAIFMSRNINVLYLFSGNYESTLTVGLKEYETSDQITYSMADDYSKIIETHPEFYQNLANVEDAIMTVISDDQFVAKMQEDNGSAAWYKHWTNEKLAVFITAVLLVVFLFIYYLIYANLQKKSRESAQNGVGKIVLEITKNLGDDDEQLTDIIDKKIKDDTDKK